MANRVLAAKQGIETDALSPRDVNAQRAPGRAESSAKVKAALASKTTQKEKEHAPAPPKQVYEPPSSDRKDGAVYKVGDFLGKGGFAMCYEGQLPGSRKKIALKVVKSKMPAKMEQKFQTELQIHSKMRQKNIVQFLRAFSFENSTYLVLELCPNGSLMDLVKRRKGLTEPEVRFYTVQIAGAIKYMHFKGIIHRDLKMGNIFLDRHMNAKIGDFGLAALLVTGKDMQTIRRTTLCGTPNYIAPEILEKGKKGHDHMVDIWSLGIIMYAMLTSKPPFQSSTTDEIYRRARNRDYEWPSSETRYISQEAKDLVAVMLEDAGHRPEPDAIVQHEFFGAGYVPLEDEITPKLREFPPDNDQFYVVDVTPRQAAHNLHNLKEMCRSCEVGPWNTVQKTYTTTWKEVALEEKAGLTPIIPLAEHIVYRPYDEVSKERILKKVSLDDPPHPILKSEPGLDQSISDPNTQIAPKGLLRQPPQSFAAQQRAQARPSKPAASRTRPVDELGPSADPTATGTMKIRTKRELAAKAMEQEVPTRPKPTSVASAPGRMQELVIRPRSTEPRKPSYEKQPELAPEKPVRSTQAKKDAKYASLFSPTEKVAYVPESNPDAVLDRLVRLQTELERALNSRTMAITGKSAAPPPPRIVVKWVDYSNKFGLGYILNDGSVGCVLRSIPVSSKDSSSPVNLPPTCIVVRDAEQHCQRRHDDNYPDRYQLVPLQKPVQFFQNHGEEGLATLSLPATEFKVSVEADGKPGKMPPGTDVHDYRKRELLVLWKKFANYMMAYGRDQEPPAGEAHPTNLPEVADASTRRDAMMMAVPPCDVVTFYQRIGDVGCWVFGDGHLQFNFPDHTKIVLDAAGSWCHFWHLPQEAAEKLAATGELQEVALDERSVLSYPLQTLLNFAAKPSTGRLGRTTAASRKRPEINPMLQGIPAANDFRRKIEFVKNVVKEWVGNGGMGNSDMSMGRRLKWTGARETVQSGPSKHVWVTIGARWGDERFMAVVDPKKPTEMHEIVDEKRSAGAA